MEEKTKITEGTLFWVLHWSTAAMDEDPGQIITYYRALRELWPLVSDYDKRFLRDALEPRLREVLFRSKNSDFVSAHVDLILHFIKD